MKLYRAGGGERESNCMRVWGVRYGRVAFEGLAIVLNLSLYIGLIECVNAISSPPRFNSFCYMLHGLLNDIL